MARLNTRASSGGEQDDEDVRQLDQARNQNDQKLKSRFERIFRKYEHNFEGVGDEIDIHSGEIVVDNGHLQNMRDEADPGRSASSRFVRTFQEKLEHEGEEDDDEEEDEDSEAGDDEASGDDDGDENGDTRGTIEPFRALTRPPPRLAQLLVGGASAAGISDDPTGQGAPTTADDSSTATATTAGLLEQVPALQDSMSALTGRSRRPTVDANTIQALGTSIANQLAQLMAGNAKKRTKKSQPKSRREAADPVWDYPDINRNNQQKRKRSPSPVVQPRTSSPLIASPGQRSLWAPEGGPGSRPFKRIKQAATPSLRRLRSSIIPSSAVRGADLTRCMNCSLTNSSTWQPGPGGGDLCVSCGKYYDLYGRMKPFDSPTPSIEEQDVNVEPAPEISLGEPLVTPDLAVGEDASLVAPSPAVGEDTLMEVTPTPAIVEDTVVEPPSAPVTETDMVVEHPPAAAIEEDIVMEPPPTLEVHEEPPQISLPTREASLEVVVLEPVVSRTTPESVATSTFLPATSVEPKLEETPEPDAVIEDTPDSMFITDTSASYPANTSRQMVSTAKQRHYSYSTEEDALIIELKEQEQLPWHVVARRFPNRTQYSVQNRYTRRLYNTSCPGRDLFNAQRDDQQVAVAGAALVRLATPTQELDWSHEQDDLLIELRQDKELEWGDIASVLPGHSVLAVQERYAELQADEVRRERHLMAVRRSVIWSPNDDALIVRLKEVDNLTWDLVAERFVDRSLQSIQKRYSRWLAPEKRKRAPSDPTRGTAEEIILEADPALAAKLTPGQEKSEQFESAEDELIKQLLEDEERPDWEQIAAHFPGRSVRTVYLRATKHLNIKLKTLTPAAPSPTLLADERWRNYSPLDYRSVRRTDSPPHFDNFEEHPSAAAETPLATVEISGPGSRRPFVRQEDDIIMQLKSSKRASWEDISLRLPGRSVKAISQRFSELLGATPGTMTPADRMQVATHPSQPLATTARSTMSSPNLDFRRYRRDEEDLITRLRVEGMSWEDMAPHFDDRTPASLEDHWYSKLRPKARKSLPASTSTNASAGLLRTALVNSRRRSDAQHGATRPAFDLHLGDGQGYVDDPIMFENDVDMNAASEQLFGEFQSSVVRDPPPFLQIDPQLLVLDQMALHAQRYERLMLAAEQFAAQQNNSQILRRVKQIYQSNSDDPRLRKLLELTTSDDLHTPSEIEWAFEAFDHSFEQAERIDSGLAGASEASSDVARTSSGGKGKGKARERDVSEVNYRPSADALMEEPDNVPPCNMGAGSVTIVKSQITTTPSDVSQPFVAAPRPQHDVVAASATYDISSDSSENGMEPLAAFLSAGKPSLSAVPAKPVKQGEIVRDEISADDIQHLLDSAPEESLGVLSRPKHSFSELIHMTLNATQSKAMHPKTMCAWIETNFEYYRTAPPNWKSGILLELNANADFEQCGTGRARPWRIKPIVELPAAQPVEEIEPAAQPRNRVESDTIVYADDYTVPCSDDDADEDDDMEDNIIVKPPPKKRGRPRPKRTTDSAKDVQEYTPIKVEPQTPAARGVPTRSRLRGLLKPDNVEVAAPVQRVPELDLTIEIADSDGADELPSSPVVKPLPQPASSGKKVRFMDTVEVRGPARASAADATPSTNQRGQSGDECDMQGAKRSSASPAKALAAACSANGDVAKAKASVPSRSPGFMKPARNISHGIGKPNAAGTPKAGSTPFPRTKSRLSQLRRESVSTGTPPRTPKANWPRRHSTPTAIFSHRASPALGRGVMFDRFGFGRKRVVETPVRELATRKDLDEDELA